MPQPSPSEVRRPAVAGMFYPAAGAECQEQAAGYLKARADIAAPAAGWLGAIVPHAGWICSGAVAGETIATLAQQHPPVDVVVIFGAVHAPIPAQRGTLDTHRRWQLPAGDSDLAVDLEHKLMALPNACFAVDERVHEREHSIEVELPLVQMAFPGARILPIAVPPEDSAVEVGRQTVQCLEAAGAHPVYLASTDLTHYGPNYRFTPAGVGPQGIQWANENDRRLLALIEKLEAEKIVPEVKSRANACGAGAIAALLAACREKGATRAVIVRHTNSFETLAAVAPQTPENAVGYAGVLVG